FVINNSLVTPPLSDSILDGVTRDSLLTLTNDLGYKTEERPVSLKELEQAFINKTITEAFGVGTAVVIAPIQIIQINNIDHQLPEYGNQSLMNRIKAKLEQLRLGYENDPYGWNYAI
ncbi:MAG: aminotransferase class IV, partial [Bacteroidia bacterium]|nr:aminotransferase class IV [Bacteroidia bacterium]